MEEKEKYKLITKYPKDEFIDIELGVNIDSYEVVRTLNQQSKRIKELEEKNKIDDFWHSAYQGKQLEYDLIYAELRKSYEENQQLKEKLNNFETCMKKYNVEDIELLDLMLFVLSGETKYHLKEIKDKHKKELKQSQKQLAIRELEMLHNLFWDTIKTGILRSYVCSIINNQIKSLKGEHK